MVDFKTRIGASLGVALLTAILVYALLNPLVVWYLELVPGLISCSSTDTTCLIVSPIIGYGVPLIALFLCVWSVFEAFL